VSAVPGVVDASAVVAWMRAFAADVTARRDELTELDAAIGDADHGVNMDRGMQAVVGKLSASEDPGAAAEGAPLGPVLKTAGMTLVSTVGGAAGPLYGTLLLEMGKAAAERTTLTAAEWADVVNAGVAGVQMRGKAEAGDKTMVDALLPAAAALRSAAGAGASLATATRAGADAAADGARATVPLVARKGRASYLGARSAGHQDPGATSTWLLLEAAARVFGGDDEAAGAAPPG
jgi:phosphoenolpyruvate---glycerone phosphotransferase subunit DhaL